MCSHDILSKLNLILLICNINIVVTNFCPCIFFSQIRKFQSLSLLIFLNYRPLGLMIFFKDQPSALLIFFKDRPLGMLIFFRIDFQFVDCKETINLLKTSNIREDQSSLCKRRRYYQLFEDFKSLRRSVFNLYFVEEEEEINSLF